MSDTFRKEYKPLTQQQKVKMSNIKAAADNLLDIIRQKVVVEDVEKRVICLDRAQDRLEEAVMWAIKGVTS